MISAVRQRPVAAPENLSSSATTSTKMFKLKEEKFGFVDKDEHLSFKRRGRGTSNIEGDNLNPVAETRPTRNKALLYLRGYKDDLTTLNSKTPIDFNRMAKQERYPSWITKKEATAAKMSTQSFHAYLQSYRKRMEKRVETRTLRISKNDRRKILAFAGKGDATNKSQKRQAPKRCTTRGKKQRSWHRTKKKCSWSTSRGWSLSRKSGWKQTLYWLHRSDEGGDAKTSCQTRKVAKTKRVLKAKSRMITQTD